MKGSSACRPRPGGSGSEFPPADGHSTFRLAGKCYYLAFDIGRIRCQSVIVPSQARHAVDGQVADFEVNNEGEPVMSLASHLEELQRKHSEIEKEIDDAMAHPSVDDLEIATLKRRKLALKDEMARLKVEEHTTH